MQIILMIHWHILQNKSGPRIDHWGTPQDTDEGWEKLFLKSTRNDLLDK